MKKAIQKTKIKLKTKKTPVGKPAGIKKVREVQSVSFLGLHNLRPPVGAHKKKKLLGRGSSSGHGKTSTRGVKGQTSRAGRDFYPGFEGGRMPLIRKIPKRGFSNLKFKRTYQIVNVKSLAKIKEPMIDPQILQQRRLIKDKDRLTKILGKGELSKPLIIKAHAFSRKAKEIIENAGGKAEIINA